MSLKITKLVLIILPYVKRRIPIITVNIKSKSLVINSKRCFE